MAQPVATILAELALESASFHRDLGKAVTDINSSSASMNKALASVERQARTMNKVIGAAVTGFVATVGVQAVKAAWDFAGSIEDMAKSTTLGTSALQELRYAAQQTGGSTESLDAAMLKFTQIVGDAANGSNTAVEALKRVGITSDDLKSKSMDQLFVEASDSLNKMGESANRNSAMVDLFGERSLKTAESLSLSSDEMSRLREEANSVGAVLGEEAIAKAAQASDQFNALATVIKVQATAAIVEFGPLLVKTTQFLADMGEMATWTAKQLGLLDKTEDDVYQSMLERRTDLEERKHKLGQFAGGILAGGQIAKIDAELAELDKKIAAKIAEYQAQQKSIASGKPDPAVTTITQPTGDNSKNESDKEAERVDKLRQSLLTEEQLLAEKYTKDWQMLNDAEAKKVATQTSYDELRLGLAAKYEADVAELKSTEDSKDAERLAAKVEALRQSYETETQLLAEKYVAEYEMLNAAEAQNIEAKASYDELRFELAQKYEQDLTNLTETEAQKRAAAEAKTQQTIDQMKMNSWQLAVGLLRGLAGESEGAAIAALAVEKALAISEVKVSTEAAAMRALAELGPVAGTAAAASIRAQGAISMGLIAATGLVQAAGISSGGASAGSAANPVYTTPAPYSPEVGTADTSSQSAVQVIIEGNMIGNQQFVDEELIPALDEAINERDYVFIRSDSRQAQEIATV